MEITCNNCETQFNIPDEKIPKGRKVALPCPKCKQRITIVPGEEGIQIVQPQPQSQPQHQVQHQVHPQPIANTHQEYEIPAYNIADRPFELLDKNAKTALLCIGYPHANELAVKIMHSMQYHIQNVDNLKTALTNMTYHLFNLIIVDEDFDINRKGYRYLMEYLNGLDMMSRRKIVVILISKTMNTLDNMSAFHASINQIINYKQVNAMETIIQRTILEHDQFYSIYNEILRKIGKMS